MRRLFRTLLTIGGIALLAWLMRDRLVNLRVRSDEQFPLFRPAPPNHQPPKQEVTAIVGIGPVFAERLAEAGIDSVGGLASADAATVAATVGVPESRATEWIEQAKAHGD